MNDKLSLTVENFDIVDDVNDEQFAIVEVYVCHDGNNAHNLPIKLSTLKKAANSLKNKYLVAGFDGNDFEGHEPDEQIIGHFPESGKISYKKKKGKTYLVAEAIMSKQYAEWAYEQFVNRNKRSVSMEITVTQFGDESDGKREIKEFVFNGVTVLGDGHTPACEGADVSIIKFNVENASQFYKKYSWKSNVILREFVDSMGTETGKEGTEDMTEETIVTETSVETPVQETENVEEVATTEPTEEVFNDDKLKEAGDNEALMEDEDEEEDKEDEDDEDAKSDADEEDAKDDEEESDKKFESLTVEQRYEVFRAACKEKGLGYLESFDDEYIYVYDYCDGFTYRHNYSLDGTEVTIGDEKTRVMRGGYVPFEAEAGAEGTVAGEGAVTEEPAEIVDDVTNPDMEALQEQVTQLKATVAQYEAERKDAEVETILSGVIDTLTPEQISTLREEAKDFSLDRMTEFSNKVKALAFESVKGQQTKYSFARVAFGSTDNEPTTTGKYSWK